MHHLVLYLILIGAVILISGTLFLLRWIKSKKQTHLSQIFYKQREPIFWTELEENNFQ